MNKSGVLTVSGILLLMPLTGWSGAKYRPNWSGGAVVIAQRPNNSILMDLNAGLNEKKELQDQLLDPQTQSELRQNYQLMLHDYEQKKRYGLATRTDQKNYIEQNNRFAEHVINEVKTRQMKLQAKNLKRIADAQPELKDPATVALAMAAIYQGTTMNWDMSEDTRLTARTEVKNSKGLLGVESPLLNGRFEYAGKAADIDPNQLNFDPTQVEERYRLSLTRSLPLLELDSGVTYGGSSSTVTASVSRKLSENLTCVVDKTHPVGRSPDNPRWSQESVKLLYGLSF
jgi:hypothetical protein